MSRISSYIINTAIRLFNKWCMTLTNVTNLSILAAHIIEYFLFLRDQSLHTICNQGWDIARSVGWLLTTGFRNSAVSSHCCWQEISARHWCAEQELIWSGLLQLKGTGPEAMHYVKRGDNYSHSFPQFLCRRYRTFLMSLRSRKEPCFSLFNTTLQILFSLP